MRTPACTAATITTIVAMSFMLVTGHLQAAERPVNIGLNANFNHWLTRSTNVGWVRVDFGWWDVNPQQGVWNFGYPDSRVADAEANGLQILAILHLVPAWAGGGPRGNVPPLTTSGWAEFVRRLAQRYPNRIAAYEIWNEPDASNSSSQGIGWDRNIEEPPRYVDFVQAAAVEIGTYSPTSRVVGPAYTSRADSSSKRNRRRRIFEQIRDTSYGGSPGYTFLDGVSFHNNGHDTTSSSSTASELRFDSLQYLSDYCFPLNTAPIWVTEYGWRSNAVGENGQREKICNITKMYTGRLASALGTSYNIDHSFIYVQRAEGTSQSLFRTDSINDAKPAVTQYLRALSYPAVQQPAQSGEYPSCAGVFGLASVPGAEATEISSAAEVGEVFAAMGLGDPSEGLPSRYEFKSGEVTDNGVLVVFSDPKGDLVRIAVTPQVESTSGAATLSEGGAEWVTEHGRVKIVRPAETRPDGLVARVAAAVDASFSRRCLARVGAVDEIMMRRLGMKALSPPRGFQHTGALHEVVEMTSGCGARGGELGDFDLMWTFGDETGAVIRAGSYRYGEGFLGEAGTATSLHWSDERGTRYWVAIDSPEGTSTLRAAMHEVADSMRPAKALGN